MEVHHQTGQALHSFLHLASEAVQAGRGESEGCACLPACGSETPWTEVRAGGRRSYGDSSGEGAGRARFGNVSRNPVTLKFETRNRQSLPIHACNLRPLKDVGVALSLLLIRSARFQCFCNQVCGELPERRTNDVPHFCPSKKNEPPALHLVHRFRAGSNGCDVRSRGSSVERRTHGMRLRQG